MAYFHLKASMYNENMFGMDVTPVRRMMESWMQYISLDFIINTIMTQDLKISRVVAGHYIEAQRAGVAIAKKVQGCPVKEKADVVIVSSHPADQDFLAVTQGAVWRGARTEGRRRRDHDSGESQL